MSLYPKTLIADICRNLESSQGAQIARDYQNALKLIAQVVFTRSSGFILEFIQNAEDAGQSVDHAGHFSVFLSRKRLKILHNARPFDDRDVRAISGIQSSKNPEKGTLGYLGIGFKSVFKVTNSPHIFSGAFQFKFDRSHWPDPNNSLWMVLPVWVEEPPETLDVDTTTFFVPLKDASLYDQMAADIRKLGTELYLFLRWLKQIDIHDEETGEHWSLENLGEDGEGVTTLRRGTETQRFKFFRKTVTVPDAVRDDELSQQYRSGVQQREIAIAFALDADSNLAPSAAGAMYGGVYSFLPLGETSSGAKFPIQADFLVQPGRDAINCEAKWNHWLVSEVEKLCEEGIEVFKSDTRWKHQFLTVFATEPSVSEAQQQLFGPRLFEPLKAYLENNACIPTRDGGWAKPDDVIRVTESPRAVQSLLDLGVVAETELGIAFSGEELHVCHPANRDGTISVKQFNRNSLMRNTPFLSTRAAQGDAADWFRKLYTWLRANPVTEPFHDRRKTYSVTKRYHDFEIVLTADGGLLQGGSVILIDLLGANAVIADLATELAKVKPVLHPDLLSGCSTESQRNELKGFLTGYTGVQIVDAKKVCEELLLPKILVTAPKPSGADLIKQTRDCRSILGSALPDGVEFWVVTKDGAVRPAKEVLLPAEFQPIPNWETNQQFLDGLNFVSPDYLDSSDATALVGWRSFFRRGGVKESPDNGVEEFAVGYVCDHLRKTGSHVQRVEKRNFGYDVEASVSSGQVMRIEVKGQTSDTNVELTGNETSAADQHKDDFFLYVVSGVPESPRLYRVQNPSAVGVKDKLTIPISVWKTGLVTP